MCRINPKVDFAFKKLFGSAENIDIALKMLTRGDSIEDVAEMTGLSAEEVSNLRH